MEEWGGKDEERMGTAECLPTVSLAWYRSIEEGRAALTVDRLRQKNSHEWEECGST